MPEATMPRPADLAADTTRPSPGRTAGPSKMAARLGVPVSVLETYLRSHGGAPDGHVTLTPEPPRSPVATEAGLGAEVALAVLVHRALPAPAGRAPAGRAPWVKRDRPRYFMPG